MNWRSSTFSVAQVNILRELVRPLCNQFSKQSEFRVSDLIPWIKLKYPNILPLTDDDLNPKRGGQLKKEWENLNPGKRIINVQNACYHLSAREKYWIETIADPPMKVNPLNKIDSKHGKNERMLYKVRSDWSERIYDGFDCKPSEQPGIVDSIQLASPTVQPPIQLGRRVGTSIFRSSTQVGQLSETVAHERFSNPPTNLDEMSAVLERQMEFNPDSHEDARQRVDRSIAIRRGQAEFRSLLLRAYNSSCAITGCDAVEALEAAHIMPYKGVEWNHITNGLLLRADIHVLFDLALMAIDPDSLCVVLASSLRNSSYAEIEGSRITSPKDPLALPSQAALAKHFAWAKMVRE
ncbi:MAG: HNH endonuclease [candidate division Zixibacteria bacterium]|nr:HNH endonuclease [candidate division Zixibacteria bacterium]